MGLTHQSTGAAVNEGELRIIKSSDNEKVIALAGNPNVGKSTVFNGLTGLNQHTGNWPGKTVTNAQGRYSHNGKNFILVDIPGTYSLMASSVEEEVARDFVCFGEPDAVAVVTDATCLERNLNLVLQILEVTSRVVICVNLLDEARKKKIHIDLDELSLQLGVPVVGASARAGKGLQELMDEVSAVAHGTKKTFRVALRYGDPIEEAIAPIIEVVKPLVRDQIDPRWVSIKLLDLDDSLHKSLTTYLKKDLLQDFTVSSAVEEAKRKLNDHGIDAEALRDHIVSKIVERSEAIYKQCVHIDSAAYNDRDRKLDRLLTSKRTGIPIMVLLMCVIFWLTITGANYPSELLSNLLFGLQDKLTWCLNAINAPPWINGLFVEGMYRTLAWVVSVMLPPMAIFFPLFTLLEDSGYLPRIAFKMDKFFKKANAHGKQSLTMCMGFGCNACGVIGCRIIDSPRERLIAILTNNFVPCNGRFPTLIAIISMFFAGTIIAPFQSVVSTLLLTGVILLGICMTLLMSKFLSKTVLKGVPSSFALELPPYRRPQVGKVIIRSILDRTLFVLGRAAAVAAPAGLIIWLMSNIIVGDMSILSHCANFLDPFARFIGLDGVILLAFVLGFPANEIVIPIIIMSYLCTGSILEFDNLEQLRQLLVNNGWTWLTAVCTMLFSLMHFPCGTTLWTIRKETKSWKWTALAFLLPTCTGILLCFVVASVARLCGLV
jgi:ferrous iron transport protein B